jgi:glycosyltransferase involved in cell wall biosynthesis
MKILYLHPRSWTGEYSILVRLRCMGHEVCVLEEDRRLNCARRMSVDFEQADDSIATFWYNPARGLERLLTWPEDRRHRRAFDGRNLGHRTRIIAAAVKHFRPDVVIASDGFSYAVPAARLRRSGVMRMPLIVSYIGSDILDCPEAEVGRRRTPGVTRLIRETIAAADLLRPVSPLVARCLETEGAPAHKLFLCPSHLVADVGTLEHVRRQRLSLRTEIRRRYGIADEAPLVVTLSGNQKGKGLHVLADAWPSVCAALPSARWLLCGPPNPWLDTHVWPTLQATGVVDTVIASGALSGISVFEHLAAADLHVNPSLCESLNMVTVEAAAVGTPTIGTDGAGIADWLERFGAGAVVPSGAAAPLADAIIRAFEDPYRLAAYSAAGYGMIADFTLDHVAAQLVSLFERVQGTVLHTES